MLAEWREMIEWKNTSYHEICNLNEYRNLKFWYKYCLQNSYFPESECPHLIDSDSICNVENISPPPLNTYLYI